MNFKQMLLQELDRRQKQNAAYSQRAFARALAVDNSRLSKILRGVRPLSPELIEAFGKRLGLPQHTIIEFIESEKSSPRHRYHKKYYTPVEKDQIEIISDWRHYAILELMKLSQFKKDFDWMATALFTTPTEIKNCVNRLQNAGLLKISKNGKWTDLSNGFRTNVIDLNKTTEAHREGQRKIIKMSEQALLNIPIENRDQSGMMMATNQGKINEAKEKIKKFRRELCTFLENCDEKNEVFQLSISLFPISNIQQRYKREGV